MTKSELSVAIIGAGRIAGGYDSDKFQGEEGIFSHAGAYKRSGKFSLDMAFDLDLQKALEFQKNWDVKKVAKDIVEVYNSKFDVVSVCTPDFSHYEIIRSLLTNKCCKTIFAEKPLALNAEQIAEVIQLSRQNNINVVVDFQRRFDKNFLMIQQDIKRSPGNVLALNGYYMKGLEHNGITMIDAITCLCEYPDGVLSYNKIHNQEINDDSYEFILFYPDFNITVKTIDSPAHKYNYHIFEIDLLFCNGRKTINFNSQQIELKEIIDYSYSGVRVLNDRSPQKTDTEYKSCLLNAVEYLHAITSKGSEHVINTPEASYNNKLIIEGIKNSFNKQQRIDLKHVIWKK